MAKFNELKFKKDKLQFIRELLNRDDLTGIEANIRALLRIYSLQTAAEQMTENTSEYNGVGFTGFDGEFLTAMAKKFIAYKHLTIKQYLAVKKNMGKYSGQLLKIALGEISNCEIENFIPQKNVKDWVQYR